MNTTLRQSSVMEFVFIAMKPNLNKPLNIADEKKRFVVVIKKNAACLLKGIKMEHQSVTSTKCNKK